MEFLDILQQYGVDISIIFIGFNALILYFGKIIGDIKVESHDRLSYYITGLIFVVVYILFPFLLAITVKNYIHINLSTYKVIFLNLMQLCILLLLLWNFTAYSSFRTNELAERYKNIIKNRTNNLIQQESIVKNYENRFKKRFGMNYAEFAFCVWYEMPTKIFKNRRFLMLFSFLTLLANVYIFYSTFKYKLFLFGMSLIFLFCILTLIAASYGFSNAYYPLVKIYTIDGEIIRGKVLKFGDFIYLLNDDKKIFINRDKIKYIEEDLFNKEETYETEGA